MKIGLLFPGYGSQYVGMGKELYDVSRIMQENFEEASVCLDTNFVKLCFASSDAELSKIEFAFPALFLTSLSIAHSLQQEHGIKCDIAAGFGIGELTAIAAAGGISLPDGLYLLHKYAQLYQEALASWSVEGLYVSGVDCAKIKEFCAAVSNEQNQASIAITLPGDACIITGHRKVIEEMKEELRGLGAKLAAVGINEGLHSPLMDSILMFLTKYLEKIDFKDAQFPVLASTNAILMQTADALKENFVEQLHAPIAWDKILKRCTDWDLVIAVGPGNELVPYVHELYPDKKIVTINKPQDIEALKEYISAMPVENS